MQFPIGVFGVAIATATLPAISRQAALQELGDFRRTLASSLRLAFVLTIPSAVGLMVLGRPIIALIYERGRFGPEDSAHTANALACYAIGLAGYAAIRILAPAFYALGDSKTPMRISLLSMVLNFVMNWLLVHRFHERGLALSTSAVAILNFALLYFAMRNRVKGLEGRATLAAMVKIIGASVVMGAACLGIGYAVDAAVADRFVARLGKVVVSVLLGAVVFYLVASWLKVAELKMAGEMIAGRLRRMLRRGRAPG
jgi:putative peptidoglycan lipid II flippase